MRNRLEADPQISLAIKNLAFDNQQQIEQTISLANGYLSPMASMVITLKFKDLLLTVSFT